MLPDSPSTALHKKRIREKNRWRTDDLDVEVRERQEKVFSQYGRTKDWKADRRPPRVRLRGLPSSATITDLEYFFEGYDVARSFPFCFEFVKDKAGKPTGHAFVYFNREDEARRARDQLHRRYLGDRYIEVYVDYQH
ncbi:unnamed protein product [Vitrella brassicaformis CCMP3155]|uniref:RRM domain-containing protein n=1 Tax=Vitrella brassicaformis (strain CCMP3155) TaxID=1169540 RepID=A0A0G4EF82_VITBC|nr:unnamed protein product [Vitrella brassicaformis CCMP3155]|eukprot:CEL94053.1 unnamed protein product [Vitrella brassicaformis CCMP3155]